MDTGQVDQENEEKPEQETVANVQKGRKKAKPPALAPGDLVFAKVKGYPFWPARIEAENSTGMKVGNGRYPVFFFGTYESAVCGSKEIIPFEPNKVKHGKNKSKKFVTGMKEIQETPNITCGPQLVTSVTVPIPPDEANVLPIEPSSTENGQDKEAVPESKPEGKKKRKSSINKKEQKSNSNSSARNKRQKTNAGGDGIEQEKEAEKPSEPVASEEEPKPKVESLEEKSGKTEKQDKKVSDKEKTVKRSEVSEEEKKKKRQKKAVEKERLKQELKEKKLEKKRKERIEQLKTQAVTTSTLTDLDIEIMESLNVESLDVARCLNAMSKLDLIQVNQSILVTYPNILYTIKKCRRFKGDATVRQKADYLFNKFKTMFTSGVDESAQKLLDLAGDVSQDSASSTSPTREDTSKPNVQKPSSQQAIATAKLTESTLPQNETESKNDEDHLKVTKEGGEKSEGKS